MTEVTAANTEIQHHLYRLCQSIAALQKKYDEEWISSRAIAKYLEGSQELAPVIEAQLTLLGAENYLIVSPNGRAATLSAAGHTFIQSPEIAAMMVKQPVTLQVADAVKAYARGIPLLRFQIQTIYTIGKVTKRYVHAIQIDLGDTLLPNEAPAHVLSDTLGKRIHGRIVGQDAENGILYVALESSVSTADLPARLEIDRAFLLYQLADALSQLHDIPEHGRALLQSGQNYGFTLHDEDSGIIAGRLAGLKPPWTHFLWGPPGAGKTYGLARLMLRLLQDNPQQRILLVAPSNIAVDVALQKFVELVEDSPLHQLLSARRILRYGYPQKSEILSRPDLLGSQDQQALSQEIGQKERALRMATKADGPEEMLSILRADLLDLQERLKGMVLAHVDNCRIVATTTTMAYMRGGPIAGQQWDIVLVDEVTMVPPAICLYLSSLAGGRLLFAGDPRQLGPIYESEKQADDSDQRWMGQDIYDFTGLSSGSGEKREIRTQDSRLVRITSQRRCTQAIWRPIRHLYKGVESVVDEREMQELHLLPPEVGQPLVIIDTGSELQQAICERHQKSWQNKETAVHTVDLARQIVDNLRTQGEQKSIAIITPYRAQYRLIKRQLQEVELQHQVEVGTIHRFQGSEADIVIFDIVDGPGRPKLGVLLAGDTGLRLVNVAISRARGKLVILADKTWCGNHMTRSQNPLLWDIVMHTERIHITQPPAATRLKELSRLPTLTESNITPSRILTMNRGQSVLIENKAAKTRLNRILSRLKFENNYERDKHVTIWIGPDGKYCVDHRQSMLKREA